MDAMPEPELIDVDGRKMAIARAGEGVPSVVLMAGFGLDMRLWRDVFPHVAAFTEVCTFDQLGVGRSDPRPDGYSVRQQLEDWRGLLATAAVPAPYVIAAHSAFGPFACIFASLYPEAVVGLVQIDATNDAVVERLRSELSPKDYATFRAPWDGPRSGEYLALLAEARLPPKLPVVVLTRGLPDERLVSSPALTVERSEQIFHELQCELAASFPGSTHRVVEGSRHLIPRDRPDAVIEAIREVVDIARRAADN